MEKGNELQSAATTATAATAGALVGRAGGAIASGARAVAAGVAAGATLNGTKPVTPWSGTVTNLDGSTRTVSRNAAGVTTITDRDARGRVTGTRTITPESDGTATYTDRDGSGEVVDEDRFGDWASSTRSDGTTVKRWQAPGGENVVDELDADGKITRSRWNGPTGSGTHTFNPDGTSSEVWESTDGTSGTVNYDKDGNVLSGRAENPNTGESWERTSKPNGDFSETMTDAAGETSTSSRTTNADGSVTEIQSGREPLFGSEMTSTTTTNPDGSSSQVVTSGGETVMSTTTTQNPDKSTTTTTSVPGSYTETTTKAADGSSKTVKEYPDGNTATRTRGPNQPFGGTTEWTDSAGNTIEDPYKIDLSFLDGLGD